MAHCLCAILPVRLSFVPKNHARTKPQPFRKRPRVNLRTPAVMAAVQAQVESHYRSEVVEKLRAAGRNAVAGDVTVKLAKQFGFCYGVERAIDLAYAAAKVFTDRRLFILGEIIHNPEVNEQIRRAWDQEPDRAERGGAGG